MSKQKKGRAGLLAAEEWLECGHVYPRKAGRTGLLGAVVCMDRTVPRCGCWARLLRGAPEDRLGLLGVNLQGWQQRRGNYAWLWLSGWGVLERG